MPDYTEILNPKHPDYKKKKKKKGVAPSNKVVQDYMAAMYPDVYWTDPEKGIPKTIYNQNDVPEPLQFMMGGYRGPGEFEKNFYGMHHAPTNQIYINENK